MRFLVKSTFFFFFLLGGLGLNFLDFSPFSSNSMGKHPQVQTSARVHQGYFPTILMGALHRHHWLLSLRNEHRHRSSKKSFCLRIRAINLSIWTPSSVHISYRATCYLAILKSFKNTCKFGKMANSPSTTIVLGGSFRTSVLWLSSCGTVTMEGFSSSCYTKWC